MSLQSSLKVMTSWERLRKLSELDLNNNCCDRWEFLWSIIQHIGFYPDLRAKQKIKENQYLAFFLNCTCDNIAEYTGKIHSVLQHLFANDSSNHFVESIDHFVDNFRWSDFYKPHR
jgi:hypothetical protein